MSKPPSLLFVQTGHGDRLIVLVHGIMQRASGMTDFADLIRSHTPAADIAIFDYDWTQPLHLSAAHLAAQLDLLKRTDIVLVGYSMGGLVARLAVADHNLKAVQTVITLATPNRGAVTTSQLGFLGQEFMGGVRWVSPLARCPGVVELTLAEDIFLERRDRPTVRAAVANKRYASIPGLYFHASRRYRSGKGLMGAVTLGLERVSHIARPHDGIVAEGKNNIVARTSTEFAEFDFAGYANGPVRLHAAHLSARELDHLSILTSPQIARLVLTLVQNDDWSALPHDPDVQVFTS
ncbi:hypothetical protein ASD21_15940 [Caulobacter sp. Root1455]|uniref:lipase family alpha/beta hydrolase n=1 Tax=Caulobacter sp. Root1455 TaxID=1736465 RepID=UPI0006FD2E74|nr:alpha/beta fold hydrolase [Caulobacter sp. Root1455]KQY91800.1 hypothetical protein ASD21_15940 [Caulobacter sp. Root1455]